MSMLKHGSKILVVAAVLVTCTAACANVASASAVHKAAGNTSTATSGAEDFQVLITSPSSLDPGAQSSLVATGVIGAGGVAVTDSYENSWVATFELPQGAF